MNRTRIGFTLAIVLAAVAGSATIALASSRSSGRDGERERDGERDGDGERGHERERSRGSRAPEGAGTGAVGAAPATPAEASYRKECGACHLAYPPHLLPARAWSRLLGTLDRHFGQNAELEPEVRSSVEGWLSERAGLPGHEPGTAAGAAGDALPRITSLAWFRREHGEVRPAVLARPSIRALSNCAACHAGAASWDFDEDRVKIPAR